MRVWALLIVFPFASGCIAYVYPSVGQTPPMSAPEAGVRAFRVVTRDTVGGALFVNHVESQCEVEEIPVSSSEVGTQRDARYSYYYVLLTAFESSEGSLRVLLYRPGFQTVEIPEQPWWRFPGRAEPERVAWTAASDLAAEEQSLEAVASPKGRRSLFGGADAGREAEEKDPLRRRLHRFKERPVLAFAAREYARLAADPRALAPGMEATHQRLLAKADEYAKLAAEKD